MTAPTCRLAICANVQLNILINKLSGESAYMKHLGANEIVIKTKLIHRRRCCENCLTSAPQFPALCFPQEVNITRPFQWDAMLSMRGIMGNHSAAQELLGGEGGCHKAGFPSPSVWHHFVLQMSWWHFYCTSAKSLLHGVKEAKCKTLQRCICIARFKTDFGFCIFSQNLDASDLLLGHFCVFSKYIYTVYIL